jgi:DNA polymerase-3 subunit delta'
MIDRMGFRDIIGHRRFTVLLSRAIARDTLPPALLLAGPPGVGKRRIAMAIAETVNCLAAYSSDEYERDACGNCASCRRIQRGVHQDVVLVEPGESGAIKVEHVRDVIDRAGYRPFEGRRRVVIIDEADSMVPAAQNALLKTLEEPPSASIFVLVSSIPDSLLPTVRSRCPRLRVGALPPGDIATALVRDHGYAESEARAAAADADGSIGQALSARSTDLTQAREMAQRVLQQAAGVSDPVRRLDAIKELTGRGGAPASDRDQLAACLRAMAALLRDVGVLTTESDPAMLANADLHGALSGLATGFDRGRSTRAYVAVDLALGALERNVSPKVVADWLVLQL